MLHLAGAMIAKEVVELLFGFGERWQEMEPFHIRYFGNNTFIFATIGCVISHHSWGKSLREGPPSTTRSLLDY